MEENYCALVISILKNCSPEQAFRYLETGKKGKASPEDSQKLVVEIKKMRKQKMSFRAIAKVVNLSPGNVYRLLKKYEDNVA